MASRPSLFRNLAGKARPVLETDTSRQELVTSVEDDISEDDFFSNPRSFERHIFSVGSDDPSHKTRKMNIIFDVDVDVDAADELQSKKAQEGDTKEVDNYEEETKSINGATKPIPRLNLFRRFDSFKEKGVHNSINE
jgi:hypothetical protein